MRPRLLILVLLLPALLGAERSCSQIDESDADDPSNPNLPVQPFTDSFNAGLLNWRLTPNIPNHQMGSGNPLPSLEVGSVSTMATGGVTVRKFDVSGGLVIEAEVYRQAPDVTTTADPEVWIGLADEEDPTGTRGLAAGMWVDDAGTLHFQVNGADIGTASAPSVGTWHRFVTTIRADRVVEFRVNGNLLFTGGSLDSWYLVRPLEACGIGYPQRPRIDNVVARLP